MDFIRNDMQVEELNLFVGETILLPATSAVWRR